jgi:septal ring factor EnvC (AmiA/AmiB activator)
VPRVLCILALALALSVATAAGAQPAANPQEADKARAQLEALSDEIARIAAAQSRRQAERGSAQAQLRDSEKALAALSRQRADLQQQLAATREELRTLEQRRGAIEQRAVAQRSRVAEELRRAWQGGGEDPARLLLNQDDPQALARLLAYYRYILGARTAVLDEYRATLAQLGELEADLVATEARRKDEEAALASRVEAMAGEKARRERSLAEVERALADDAARLAARQRERAQLEELLREIEAALAAAPEAPEDVQPFSAARGQMPWPVQGRITHRFGQARNQGKMRWQGVRLRAEAGSTVSAIHHGRVVYADWLRGSGLLMVIDHGEGYMSLYAHNEALLREVGDWVGAGAAVATVGDSGGQSEPALYFEIRKDGKPTDPRAWCRG